MSRHHWMKTYMGRTFYPADPRPEDVDINDIRIALSRICRFGGHVRCGFYSVAQHSVLVADLVRELGGTLEEQRWGLLHDAAEAYLGDVIWPLKQAPEMAGYKLLEGAVERAIMTRFELPLAMPPIVKHADLVLLATEKRDVMGEEISVDRQVEAVAARAQLGAWHSDHVDPLERHIEGVFPEFAGVLFGRKYDLLFGRAVA